MTLADLDRVSEALESCAAELRSINCHCIIDTGADHVHLHTCSANNTRERALRALTLLRRMREGAVEVEAWRFQGGPWHASEESSELSTGVCKRPGAILIPPPEDV